MLCGKQRFNEVNCSFSRAYSLPNLYAFQIMTLKIMTSRNATSSFTSISKKTGD